MSCSSPAPAIRSRRSRRTWCAQAQREVKRAAQQGRPHAHATIRPGFTFGDDGCAGRSRVVLGAGHSLLIGGARRSRPTPFAPPTAGVAHQSEWHHAGRDEYAKRQHHPNPIGIHRYIPLSTIPPTNSDALGRSNFHAQAREIGRPITGINRQTCARQPGVTLANVRRRKKVPVRSDAAKIPKLLESPSFLILQSSHALCDGIV